MRGLRARIGGAERVHLSERAAFALSGWQAIVKARRVALFASLADEIDTTPLFDVLRNRGLELVLPRVDTAKTSLEFAVVEGAAELVDGAFGLKEPVGPAVPVASIDIVVLPGLAFDRFGGRLGYGVGYYDRALADYEGLCIGYGYAFQMVREPLPQAPHDVRMTALAHDHGLELCEPGP